MPECRKRLCAAGLGIAFVDAEARIDGRMSRTIAWFHSARMIKNAIDAKTLIDGRYALPVKAR